MRVLTNTVGLSVTGGTIPMNPTWVMNYPDGNETGKYLVLDMGGTNLRVYCIKLTNEKCGFEISQESHKLPDKLKTAKPDELWDFVAGCLESFLHSADFDLSTEIDLSFIFSFPTTQRTIDEGILQRWTKGFNIADSEGQDAAGSLRRAIAKKVSIPIKSYHDQTTNSAIEPSTKGLCRDKRHNRYNDGLSLPQF